MWKACMGLGCGVAKNDDHPDNGTTQNNERKIMDRTRNREKDGKTNDGGINHPDHVIHMMKMMLRTSDTQNRG